MSFDAVIFASRVRRYIQWRGADTWEDFDDIASEMVLDALEHPHSAQSLAYCYAHAKDCIDPRVIVWRDGQRHRQRLTRLSCYDMPEETILMTETRKEVREAGQQLMDAVASLKPRLQAIILLYYYAEMNMSGIANIAGYTVSRISQLRTQALQELRQRLEAVA